MGTASLIYIFISTCLAFTVKGLVGFGDPLIFTPLLSVYLPNAVITPAFAPVSPFLNVGLVWKNRKYFNPKIVLPIVAFNMLGIIPGTLLLKFGSPQGLKLLAGLVIIAMGVEMLTRKQAAAPKQNVLLRSVAAFFSGMMAALFGMNMLILAYMERFTTSREDFRANACFILFVENLFRLVMFATQGLFTLQTLKMTGIVFPAAIAGMLLGGWLDQKVSDALSKKFLIYVFILGGISTAVYAVLGML
ncbi:MAG: sulfite exporter TauE/SafE family protein [Oscillospiraceae bacterium]|nr:sulfite exporter TauE/SafE family protein [Oscillospiraceae bacterium]